MEEAQFCIHRLSLRYSKPSLLYNFSLDVPLIAPVIAGATYVEMILRYL